MRGLHLGVSDRRGIARLAKFVREALPREGVNVLVAEIDYSYAFHSYPRVAGPNALTQEDLGALLEACHAAGVELVPQINCLGHQSWGGRSSGLLSAFPEFDETPWIPQDAGQDAIYCRSYCPNHPKVHKVVFALIGELAEVCGAGKFHVGMDEVFLIGEEKCPRCAGQDRAKLFAAEATRLHDYLKGLAAADVDVGRPADRRAAVPHGQVGGQRERHLAGRRHGAEGRRHLRLALRACLPHAGVLHRQGLRRGGQPLAAQGRGPGGAGHHARGREDGQEGPRRAPDDLVRL